MLDKIIGVQSTKKQLNSDGFPKQLMYILSYIKYQAWNEIKQYLIQFIIAILKKINLKNQ